MNAWGIAFLLIGAIMVIVAFRGNEANLMAAFLGRQWQGSSLS